MTGFVTTPCLTSLRTTVGARSCNVLSARRWAWTTGASRRAHICPPTRASTPRMRVVIEGDGVYVHYTGFLEDGSQFDSSHDRGDPLNFVVGSGAVIRGFDDGVMGLKVGESREVRVEPDRGYGKWSEEMVFSLRKTAFPTGIVLELGKQVPLSNGLSATITDISDDKVTMDANHPLAGKTLSFNMQLVGFAEFELSPPADGLQRAVFGLGCFWGAELAYQRVEGVVSTKVGYTKGTTEKPTYKQVCSGTTGHTEAVAVDFDPTVVSYEALVGLFWERLGKSALTLNQVGNDVGTQYRSGIYVLDETQRRIAEESKQRMDEQMGQATVVEIESGDDVPFYLAEDYHQRYLERGGQSAEKGATEYIRCYG